MSRRPLPILAALVATAALGGTAAVGAVALLGGFEADTTVVTETVAASDRFAPRRSLAMSVNEIYERAAPGVVQITTVSSGANFSGQDGLGSGFVLDKAGHIVTNYHVVRNSDQIRVSFSNQDTVEAQLVGDDPSTDVAILRVQTSAGGLTPLRLGDSDKVQVGDPVVAIGNPFGLDRTATAGIVSALQRYITAPNSFTIDHVIQTDAPINHGNSGGPLLNANGEVIGVNTQIETGGVVNSGNVGIGFAVPSNTVKDVAAQILKTGRVDHAFLGIKPQEVTSEVAETYNLPVDEGVIVASVTAGSGADKAGIRSGDTPVVVAGETYVLGGDIIVAVDGQRISSITELRDVIAAHKPGDKVPLQIFRDGKKTSVIVALGRQPPSPQG